MDFVGKDLVAFNAAVNGDLDIFKNVFSELSKYDTVLLCLNMLPFAVDNGHGDIEDYIYGLLDEIKSDV